MCLGWAYISVVEHWKQNPGSIPSYSNKEKKTGYVCCSITITKLFGIRKKALLSKGVFLNHIYFFECVGTTPQLEDCLLELVLSFLHVSPRDQTQFITLGPSGQLQVLASILGLTGCLFYDSLKRERELFGHWGKKSQWVQNNSSQKSSQRRQQHPKGVLEKPFTSSHLRPTQWGEGSLAICMLLRLLGNF